jgi:hypothetical protein
MSTPYTGNATAAQSPAVAPGPGIIPVVSTLQDGIDNINSAAFAQQQKLCADFFAFHATPGRVMSFRERWDIAAASLSATTNPIADLAKRWSFSIVAGATQTCAFQNPSTAGGNYACRNVKLNQGTGNAAQQSYISTAFPIWSPPSVAYRCLLEFDLQATTSTLNSREWHLGWSTTTPTNNIADNVTFYNDYTEANWQAQSNALVTDTGVAVSIGTAWHKFSILIDTSLATPSALYYIDYSLVATRTVGLPAASTDYYLLFGGRQVSTGTCAFTLGEVVVTCTKA